ncbi:MAG TPA: L-histidine N(alpha)-methyltransferase [Anaerolineales bacterium]
MIEAGTQSLLHLHEVAIDTESVRREVLHGLQLPAKELPCKLFYDERGSELFERICELDEYYLTRTEIALLERHGAEIAALMGPRALLIELGSGNSRKTRILLDRLAEPAAYLPIDLAREQLLRSARAVASAHPLLEVHPLVADYTQDFRLPEIPSAYARRVGFFPGSTVGNFLPEQVVSFLRRLRELLGPAGALLIGVDLKKDPLILHRAYNDQAGVTAQFNLNILAHLNHRFGSDFQLEQFAHQAHYNRRLGRIEMHLISREDHQVHIGDLAIPLRAGERILTEVSYKYSRAQFGRIARGADLEVERVWTDPRRWFSLLWLTAG